MWHAAVVIPAQHREFSHIFLLRFTIIFSYFFTLAFILASYIITNLPGELLSLFFPLFRPVVINLSTLSLYISFLY